MSAALQSTQSTPGSATCPETPEEKLWYSATHAFFGRGGDVRRPSSHQRLLLATSKQPAWFKGNIRTKKKKKRGSHTGRFLHEPRARLAAVAHELAHRRGASEAAAAARCRRRRIGRVSRCSGEASARATGRRASPRRTRRRPRGSRRLGGALIARGGGGG